MKDKKIPLSFGKGYIQFSNGEVEICQNEHTICYEESDFWENLHKFDIEIEKAVKKHKSLLEQQSKEKVFTYEKER